MNGSRGAVLLALVMLLDHLCIMPATAGPLDSQARPHAAHHESTTDIDNGHATSCDATVERLSGAVPVAAGTVGPVAPDALGVSSPLGAGRLVPRLALFLLHAALLI